VTVAPNRSRGSIMSTVRPPPLAFVADQLGAAEIRETHSGIVILLGEFAYKLKKPVDLGFLDFRTPEARYLVCRRELELNRRLAPDVYLDLATFARSGDVSGEPVLVMRRMPDELRLATLIRQGADVEEALRLLARQMAGFHSGAARSAAIAAAAGPDGLKRRWMNNLRETQRYAGAVLDVELCERIRGLALGFVDGRTPLLAERAAAGYAVDGHGDLIAEDVFCLPDGPRVLDCLEFDDALRWVDVLDDLAFLAMDIERLGRADLATTLLDWYTEFSGTPAVESLWHHYIAYRAFVRAKVACIRFAQGDPNAAGEADRLARLALRHLQAGEVSLVLVGGPPGTGKSTIAAGIADRTGAVLLSSDAVRREQGWPTESRYGAQAKTATYQAMLERTRQLLEHGETVVADATWGDAAWRRHAADIAASTRSRLISLECHTPTDLAAARAERRLHRGTDSSEAGGAVARALAIHRDPWLEAILINTSGEADQAIDAAVAAIQPTGDP
jgi:aminoglycoside phosphotransferase family enzyme/predicted kinase